MSDTAAIVVPAMVAPRSRRRLRGARVISGGESLLFMAPAILLSAALVLYPLLNGVRLAFTNASPLSRRVRYVGFDNFVRLLSDDGFWTAVGNSIGLVAVSVGLAVVVGYLVALLCESLTRGVAVFRTAVFLVWVVPYISVAILWGWLFDANYGLLNAILQSLGLISTPVNFLADPWLARMLLVSAYVWRMTPFMMIISIAALRGVPREVREAASIDGASKFAVFRYIQLPKMRGVLMIAVLLRFMDSFMIYTEPFVLTGGGPGNSTTFLSQYLTQKAVGQFDLGPAAAFSLIYFLIILLLCFILYTWMQRVGTVSEGEQSHG